MQCPHCNKGKTYVTTTVQHASGGVLRYRKCPECTESFSTMENVYKDEPKPIRGLPKLKPSLPKQDVKLINKIKTEVRRKNEDRRKVVPSYFIEEEDW